MGQALMAKSQVGVYPKVLAAAQNPPHPWDHHLEVHIQSGQDGLLEQLSIPRLPLVQPCYIILHMCIPQLSPDMEGPNVWGKAQNPVTEGIPECNVSLSRQVGGGKESASVHTEHIFCNMRATHDNQDIWYRQTCHTENSCQILASPLSPVGREDTGCGTESIAPSGSGRYKHIYQYILTACIQLYGADCPPMRDRDQGSPDHPCMDCLLHHQWCLLHWLALDLHQVVSDFGPYSLTRMTFLSTSALEQQWGQAFLMYGPFHLWSWCA